MTGERASRTVDVLVVGAGPSGLAAAAALARAGAGVVEVVDREQEAGGIPRHSVHSGYGVRDLHRVMSGPTYAAHQVRAAVEAGAQVRTGVMVTGWAGPRSLDTTSAAGLERVSARAVVLATGARERPRAARLVPGSRPAGVFTTGELQQAVYLQHQGIGRRAVVVGAEHVSFSAVVTLAHAGVKVAAMVTSFARHQSYAAFRVGARARWGFPLLTDSAVVRIVGRGRVEAVHVRLPDGRVMRIPCDTVVFTGDWIPDHELARRGDLVMDPGTRGPAVAPDLSTSRPGVFAVGNLVHPVLTADLAALGGAHVAAAVLAHLRGVAASSSVPVMVDSPLQWITPNRVAPGTRASRDRFVVWSNETLSRPVFEVRQGTKLLHRESQLATLIPQRPHSFSASWLDAVDVDGGAVQVIVSGRSTRVSLRRSGHER